MIAQPIRLRDLQSSRILRQRLLQPLVCSGWTSFSKWPLDNSIPEKTKRITFTFIRLLLNALREISIKSKFNQNSTKTIGLFALNSYEVIVDLAFGLMNLSNSFISEIPSSWSFPRKLIRLWVRSGRIKDIIGDVVKWRSFMPFNYLLTSPYHLLTVGGLVFRQKLL